MTPDDILPPAERLVERAIMYGAGKRAPGYKDDKMLISMDEMTLLLHKGAKIVRLNQQDTHGSYITEAVYYGFRFQTVESDHIMPDDYYGCN